MKTDITVNLQQWNRLVSEHRAMREALENLLYEPMAERTVDAAKRALAAVKGVTK